MLKGSLANYQRDTSPFVRAEVARIQGRIDQQINARTGPSAPVTDGRDRPRDQQPQRAVPGRGRNRTAFLDRMSGLRSQAEAGTKTETPRPCASAWASCAARPSLWPSPPRMIQPVKPTSPDCANPGSSFDCERANTPLPILTCEDVGGPRIDLDTVCGILCASPPQARGGAELKADLNDLVKRTIDACRVPETGKVTAAAPH